MVAGLPDPQAVKVNLILFLKPAKMGLSLVKNGGAPMLVHNCPLTTSIVSLRSFDAKLITRFSMITLIIACLMLLNPSLPLNCCCARR